MGLSRLYSLENLKDWSRSNAATLFGGVEIHYSFESKPINLESDLWIFGLSFLMQKICLQCMAGEAGKKFWSVLSRKSRESTKKQVQSGAVGAAKIQAIGARLLRFPILRRRGVGWGGVLRSWPTKVISGKFWQNKPYVSPEIQFLCPPSVPSYRIRKSQSTDILKTKSEFQGKK